MSPGRIFWLFPTFINKRAMSSLSSRPYPLSRPPLASRPPRPSLLSRRPRLPPSRPYRSKSSKERAGRLQSMMSSFSSPIAIFNNAAATSKVVHSSSSSTFFSIKFTILVKSVSLISSITCSIIFSALMAVISSRDGIACGIILVLQYLWISLSL